MMFNCLECGKKQKECLSLCDDCLTKEFEKMDKGIASGYLYASYCYSLKKKE